MFHPEDELQAKYLQIKSKFEGGNQEPVADNAILQRFKLLKMKYESEGLNLPTTQPILDDPSAVQDFARSRPIIPQQPAQPTQASVQEIAQHGVVSAQEKVDPAELLRDKIGVYEKESDKQIERALQDFIPGTLAKIQSGQELDTTDQIALSLLGSTTTVFSEPLSFLLSLAGKDDWANRIRAKTKSLRKYTDKAIKNPKDFELDDLATKEFWATKGVSLIPPLLALVPLSMAGAAAGGAAAGAAGLGRAGTLLFQALGSTLSGTPAEALMESAQKFEEVYQKTGDKDKAAKAAADVGKANVMLLSGSNAIETGLALSGGLKGKALKRVLQTVKELPKPAKKAIVSYFPAASKFVAAGLMEGGEEAFQGEFQRVYTGETGPGFNAGTFAQRMQNMTPDEKEQFVLGAIMGMAFQGAGALSRDKIMLAGKKLSNPKASESEKTKAAEDLIEIIRKDAQRLNKPVDELLETFIAGRGEIKKAGKIAEEISTTREKPLAPTQGQFPPDESIVPQEPAADEGQIDDGMNLPDERQDQASLITDAVNEAMAGAEGSISDIKDQELKVDQQPANENLTAEEKVTSEIDENAPDAVKTEADQRDAELSKTSVYDVNVSEINTDEDRFQNRAANFSEKTAATIAERYDQNLFDPIVLWRDPEDGKTYVLSGHSRLEGMKRRGAKDVPARFFQGSEEDAIKFAKLEANRLGAAENLSETINAYREAKEKKLSKKRMVDLFDGDTNWLDAAININPKGDFVKILSQPGEASSEFPYIKRFSRWVGDLRGKYGNKLTNRHEQQIFDFLYKGEKKNQDIKKDEFYELIESQINRTDFNPDQPLVLKRAEKPRTGTRARKDTAKLEEQLDQLRSDLLRARTNEERDAIQSEIARVRNAVKDIVRSQGDLFDDSTSQKATTKPAQRGKEKEGEPVKIKTEKTPAGEQVSFKPKPKVPKGKIKPKKQQEKVEGASGIGMFAQETETPKTKDLFGKDEGLQIEAFERGGKKYERIKFRDANKSEIGSPSKRKKIVDEMPDRAGWEKTYLSKEKGFYYVRKRQEGGEGIVRDEALGYSPTFYSKLERTLRKKLPGKGTPESMLNTIRGFLKKGEFKKEEYDWLGLDEWLQSQKGKISKQDILDFLAENKVVIEEIEGSEQSPFNQDGYVFVNNTELDEPYNIGFLLDEEGYSESDLGLDDVDFDPESSWDGQIAIDGDGYGYLVLADGMLSDGYIERFELSDFAGINDRGVQYNEPNLVLPGGRNYKELLIKTKLKGDAEFIGSHFDDPNIIVHVRFNERTDDSGNKVLFIEEIQSDWHQAGRKRGYSGGPGKENPVPDAPFKTTWQELAMKRMLRYAAENGFDKVAWTTGEQQTDRYDLRKQIKKIEWSAGEKPGQFNISAIPIDMETAPENLSKKDITLEEIEDFLGKEVAKQIKEANDRGETSGELTGKDLRVGGEGMSAFYDRIIPNFVKKYVKKWGSKVGKTKINIADDTIIGETSIVFDADADGYIVERQNVTSGKIEYLTDTGKWVEIKSKAKVFGNENDAKSVLDNLEQITTTEVHSVEITPEMKESVLKQGQPLFERRKGYETREGEKDQEKIGKREIKRLEMGDNRRTRGVLLANAIAEDFKQHGATELVGKTVSSPDELAVMAQIYRNPSFETLRYFFVKGGKIVHAVGVSSRLPGATAGFPGKFYKDEGIKWLKEQLGKTGADKFYILHNHPSGQVKPSKNDLFFTQNIKKKVDKYAGHVIINHGKYTVIDKTAKAFEEKSIPKIRKSKDPLTSPSKPHVLIGELIKSVEDLAEIGFSLNIKDGWSVLIGRSADGKIRGLMEIPTDLVGKKLRFIAQIRSFARKTGSVDVAMVVEDRNIFNSDQVSVIADYIRTGVLLDAVDFEGFGLRGAVVDEVPVEHDPLYTMGKRFDDERGVLVRDKNKKQYTSNPIAKAGRMLFDAGTTDKSAWRKAMLRKFGEGFSDQIDKAWPGERYKPSDGGKRQSKAKPKSTKKQRATFIERPKEGLQASYLGTKAYTKEGAKLIHRIKKDKTGKKYNIRSVVDYLNNALGVEMRVGNEQLTGKTVAEYYSDPLHLYRTRAGDGIWNFHELGHATANILAKTNKAYGKFLKENEKELIALTEAEDSFASAATPHEGFAELFMDIIVAPEKSRSKLSVALERLLKKESPDLYKSVLDARTAFNEHMKRPITVRWHSKLAPIKPEPLHKRMQTLYHWFMYKAFSAEFAPIQRIESPIYAKIAKISKKLAEAAHKEAVRPVKESGHMLWHIPTETARAVYGGGKGRPGVRIYINPEDFANLSADEIELFNQYGIDLPGPDTKNGDEFYLTDYSLRDVINAVGKDKWQAFEEYAQAKAAIDRLEKKNLVYPGMYDDAPPEQLRKMIDDAETANPGWPEQFARVNEFMNRLLLINILSGEITASEYRRIVDAYDYYVPLPRDVERGVTRMGQSGGRLWSGLRRAKGSPARFVPLSEAIEQRVRLTISSYFHNRMRNEIIRMGKKIAQMDGIPDDAKRAANRVMVPLNLDIKKVATLSPDEMKQVIADFLNEKLKKEAGGEIDLDKVKPSDINLSLPGRPIYRAVDPNAVNVVTTWEVGKGLRFYQVEDPIMYDFMTRSEDVPKALKFMTDIARDILRPWKQSITHSPVFVVWNIARDAFTSMMLAEGKERFVVGGAMAVGLVNRIMGKKGVQQARADAELLSMSLEHTLSSDHRLASNAFMDVLKEGIWIPGYRRMSLSDKVKAAPGQLAFTLAKPFEMINWITGFRALAQSSETVTREGAYVLAKKRGAGDEAARTYFDQISGNFISKPGSAVLASIYRAGGFFNPAIQVIGQTIDRGTNPRTRSEFWAVTLPYMALAGATLAATMYLLMDDEERDAWKELDDSMRLRYFPFKLPGLPAMRIPFDYGPAGAVTSFGFNKVMGFLTKSPTDNSKMAEAMLKRATDMPGLLDVMLTPFGKTFLELKADYSFFYGRSIRPPWMKTYYQDTPELQAYTSTPEIYRRLGKHFEQSPIMIEYAMRNLLGTSGSELIRVTEQVERMGLKEAFTESPIYEKPFIGRLFWRPTVGYNSRSVKELGDAAKKYETAKIRIKKLAEANPKDPKIKELREQLRANEYAWKSFREIRKLGKQINELKKQDLAKNKDKINRLAKKMRDIAKKSLEKVKKFD